MAETKQEEDNNPVYTNKVVCFNKQCKHNHTVCNLKQIILDKNGECQDFTPHEKSK